MNNQVQVYYPEESLIKKYEQGDLADILRQLLAFVRKKKSFILESINDEDKASAHPALASLRRLIDNTGSVNLPFEMGRQIQEINKELWIQGEKGIEDPQLVKENWAQTYAGLWRQAYKIELLYVMGRHEADLLTELNQ